MLVRQYHSMARNIPKERISHLTCTRCTLSQFGPRTTINVNSSGWFGETVRVFGLLTSAECNLDIAASDPGSIQFYEMGFSSMEARLQTRRTTD